MKNGYKYVEELGYEIPEGWKTVNLWDIAEYINGMPFKPEDWKDNGTPIIRIQNLTGTQEKFNYYTGKADDKYYVLRGDLLLSWSATLDVFKWEGENAILNQHIFKVIPNRGFDRNFLYYLLKFNISTLKSKTHGTGMTHITKRDMKTITLASAVDLTEQKNIAKVLLTIDMAIENSNQLLEKENIIKRSLMLKLFTKGIGHKKFKHTEIGEIPEEWNVRTLIETSTIKGRIGWQGLTTKEYLENGEYYLITGTNFKNGMVDWANCVYVSSERYTQDPHIQLKENDLLITKDGSIGKIALVDRLPGKATLNSGIFVIRPLENSYIPRYMYWIMQSEFFDRFMRLVKSGSTISHLYQKDFINFKFPVAPYHEQEKIVEILSQIDASIKLETERNEKLNQLKLGLMNDLLTGKYRVLGDLNDSNSIQRTKFS